MTTIIPDQPLPRRSESGMATRKVNAAAGVVLAAMKAGRQTPTSIAIALDSACLLNSPEQAAEFEQLRDRLPALKAELFAEQTQHRTTLEQRNAHANELLHLRARVAELEARLAEDERPTDEDPIAYTLTDKAETLEDDVTPQVRKLRALLAEQRDAAEADGITQRIAPVQALRLEQGADG
ncbi:hypothetical protein [Streptomyces triticisoli]|uniref:hypothetical protein n=1 Tax=Streptomyces triticisoli TaxID=2182797 RepID=UPI000DD7AEE5|nr:hypothetical protein [Streptomyces triticisoli]